MSATTRAGFLVFPGAEELDFVGPWELLTLWTRYLGGPCQSIIISEVKQAVRCAGGLAILPDFDFADCPRLDYLFVPGGQGATAQLSNQPIVDFIRNSAASCRSVISVCTGAFLLHRAGLLTGKRAVTHWSVLAELRALGDVDVVEERYLVDGRVWTSAGVSAGIDLTLELIAREAGDEVAGQVQLFAEYFPDGKLRGSGHRDARAPWYVKRSRL